MIRCGEYFEDQRENMGNQCQFCKQVDQPQNLDFHWRQISDNYAHLYFCHIEGKGCWGYENDC